jgi:hypothetical protein
MVKATKTGRLREKTLAEVKQCKQTTFDSLPAVQQKPVQNGEANRHKQIVISEICIETKEDDLDLKVAFRLAPSKAFFSKITADPYFDGQKLHSYAVRIPQGPLSADDFDLPVSLDMRGISAGPHLIRIEMYELWNSTEKLTGSSKEVTIDYIPVHKQDRYIKMPILRNPSGEINVVSESERDLYRETLEDAKKDLTGKRYEW